MAGTAAAPGWLGWQGIWEASIQAHDSEVRRRPYHRNCGCALHRLRIAPSDAPCPSSCSVSYPLRRRSASWHSLTSSSSSANLATAASSTGASPRTSIDGSTVAFTMD